MGIRIVAIVALMAALWSRAADAGATIELYATFNSIGVTVTIAASDDPDGDLTTAVAYQAEGAGTRASQPLARVSSTRLVGSIFDLTPGQDHAVKVFLFDPDGGVLDGVVVDGAVTTRATPTTPAPLETLVVSTTGSGTACSLAVPCSLATALGRAAAGSHVLLRAGTYYEGGLSLETSGTAEAPIVITSYQGESVAMDGADPATFAWLAQGGGVWMTTVNVAAPHLVLASYQRLYPYPSLGDLQGLSWGVPGFFASGTTLYVRLAGDADPNSAIMTVSRQHHALELSGASFVQIKSLTFRNYGQGDWAKAVYLRGASDCWIDDCAFLACDVGVGLKYDAGRNLISGCEFGETIDDFPWDAVKSAGTLEDGGVVFFDPVTGRGNVIRESQFYGDFDAMAVCTWATGATNETDVHANWISWMGDDGISTDGDCSNVRIWDNHIENVLMGISLAPVQTGPVYALRNVIHHIGHGGSPGAGGSGFKLNSGYGQSGPIFLYHNTVDAANPAESAFAIFSPGSWTSLVSRNNAWSGTAYAIQNSNPTQPLDLDHDLLYTSQVGELVWWADLPDRHLNTLAELQSATGQEPHGVAADPRFTDPDANDYTPSSSSLLADHGVVLPNINDDYWGDAPDIGAIERLAPSCRFGCTASAPRVARVGQAAAFHHEGWLQYCYDEPLADWDFGDGSPHSAEYDPSHTYAAPGSYTWRHIATTDGRVCTVSGTIEVMASLEPEALQVDQGPAGSGTANLNSVFEPGETVLVAPSWHNFTTGGLAVTGTLSAFAGPEGPSYAIVDGSGGYGTIAPSATSSCLDTDDCYALRVSDPAGRPETHWDVTVRETLSNGDATSWTLHLGESFLDVPVTDIFYPFVETVLHAGVTLGCTTTTYCPVSPVTRDQMAAFIARAMRGSDEVIWPSGTVPAKGDYYCWTEGTSLFADVPANAWYCKHVHYIASQGVTLGCTLTEYCPTGVVNRAEMAMFIARAAAGGDTAVPETYHDPVSNLEYSCSQASPQLYFSDILATDPWCRHAHYLWARQIINGCSASPPMYCPADPTTRGQMAKFLVNGFSLSLYGP